MGNDHPQGDKQQCLQKGTQFDTPCSYLMLISGPMDPVVDRRSFTGLAKLPRPVKADLAICSLMVGMSG